MGFQDQAETSLQGGFKIELSAQKVIDMYFNKAEEILIEKWTAVEALSKILLEKRFIEGNELNYIIDKNFYNGLILEVHESFLVINDRMLGESPIAFSEIAKSLISVVSQ